YMPAIKNYAIVRYEDDSNTSKIEAVQRAQNEMQGKRWPTEERQPLTATFITEEEATQMQETSTTAPIVVKKDDKTADANRNIRLVKATTSSENQSLITGASNSDIPTASLSL